MRLDIVRGPLFQAFGISLLLHLLMLFGAGWPQPIRPALQAGSVLVVVGRTAGAPLPAHPEHPTRMETKTNKDRPAPATPVPTAPLAPRVLAVDQDAASHVPSPLAPPPATSGHERAAPATQAGPLVSPARQDVAGENLSADGLREYRIGLAAAARRYRHYPASARARGLEGTAEISVQVGPALSLPVVRLARSSGHAMLDEQALAMLNQAVRSVPLPDSLRGREFTVPLPIQFSLDGD